MHFCTDANQRDELTKLASKENAEALEDMTSKQMMTVVDFLERFNSIKVPLAAFFQIVPNLAPRYYTIASSSMVHPTKVRIAISLTVDPLPGGGERLGVTSDFLRRCFAQLQKGEQLVSRVFFKESLFKMPDDHSAPIVMVGPGTGVVPFIGMSEERQQLRKEKGVATGECDLFFGCRHRDQDFIYEEEMRGFVDSGVVT